MSHQTQKPTPAPINNRAGQTAVQTRVGTQSRFDASMRRGLADANRPGLADLQSRARGDFSLRLLDAWAAVCDTLTFYDERHANEAYLRTATERASIRAHARLIGYELAPAKAAATHLAFQAESENVPDGVMTFEPGLAVRSVPRDDEQPLLFETIEPLTARPGWNALTPRMHHPQRLADDSDQIMLESTAPRLQKGDPVVFVQGATPVSNGGSGFLRRVSFSEPGIGPRVRVGLTAAPSGTQSYVFQAFPMATWMAEESLSSATLSAAVADTSWTVGGLGKAALLNKVALPALNTAFLALPVMAIEPIQPELLRVRVGFFGNIAMTQKTSPVESVNGNTTTVQAQPYSTPGPGRLTDTMGAVGDTAPGNDRCFVYLEREVPEITPGQFLILRDAGKEIWVTIHAAETQSVEAYGMSAKVTRLELDRYGHRPYGGKQWVGAFKTRTTVAFCVAEPLPLATLPITADVGAGDGDLGADQIELSTAELLLQRGKKVAITGERADLGGVIASEIQLIDDHVVNAGHSVLTFAQPMAHRYVRDTVTICANVAEATHGETRTEVLGDGDATVPFQQFALKSGPLTHVSARTLSGMAPALEMRVDRVRWDRVDDFRDSGPDDRIYQLRIDEDGTARVVFGDGITGQRVPTGDGNVEAVYRVGAGIKGHLAAGQLTLMAGKPAGLKSVTNPLPPGGAAEPEALEDARRNAPLKVLTLGRAVSLQDYQDFALGFASVAKARADWTFDGFDRPIFVTVAGQGGAILDEAGTDMANLRAALSSAGEADQHVSVRNYRPVGFGVTARLYLDPAHDPDHVLETARAHLLACFGFEAQQLGQPTSRAQIYATLQAVSGVRGVDVDRLFRLGEDETDQPRLLAAVAQPDLSGNRPDPAELLVLDDSALRLEVAS